MVQSADWRAASPNSLLRLRAFWIFLCHVRLFLAIIIGWITFVSIIGILEFRNSFLPFLSFAISPICLVVGILIFVGHIGLPAGATFSKGFEPPRW